MQSGFGAWSDGAGCFRRYKNKQRCRGSNFRVGELGDSAPVRVLSLHLCGAGRCASPPPSMITVMSAALMANSPPIYCDPSNPAKCTCNGVPIGPDTWTAPSWLESNSDLRSCLEPTALYDVLPELTVYSRVCSQRLPYTRPAPLSVVCPPHCQNSRQRQRCWSTLRPHEGCRT